MILNCDIGERGADHPVDRELMSWIGMANVACGGHAGDESSIETFREIAERHGVALSAHLSYPDRVNFGRRTLDLSWPELAEALELQWARVSDLTAVKFHGALYHDSGHQPELARALAGWLYDHGVGTVLCPAGSELAVAANARGVQVMAEAFAERRYQVGVGGRLELVPRSIPGASISDLATAVEQARSLIDSGEVNCLGGEVRSLSAETVCIHSDSPLALDLAQAVAQILEGRG